MLKPTTNAIQREERLATVWLAHIQDAGFSMNSYWSQSMDYLELQCNLPTSHEEFKRKVGPTVKSLTVSSLNVRTRPRSRKIRKQLTLQTY